MIGYWVVGATWKSDQYDKFIRRGVWILGWSDEEKPDQAKLRDQMKPGDRIAIKKRLGRGTKEIAIRAIGVIKEIDDHDKRVYVDWLVKDLDRKVPSRGAYASVHGPYNQTDKWVWRAFSI